MRPITRPEPALPVEAMKTYGIYRPTETHTRPATCAEVECLPHQQGWATTVLVGSDEEADVRRAMAGRLDPFERRAIEFLPGDGTVRFVFAPGQACFRASAHRVPLERPELYVVRGGDWRGRTTPIRRHERAEEWVEDFAEHQARLARELGVSS